MSVYVDNAKNSFGRMKMCHLLADSRDELFKMADKIGVARKWYQGFDKASCPHFDIAQARRALAIQYGAIVVDRQELAAVMRAIKDRARAKSVAGEANGWE